MPKRASQVMLREEERLIASDPTATKWHILVDNLNIHQSESLVRWIADLEGIAQLPFPDQLAPTHWQGNDSAGQRTNR